MNATKHFIVALLRVVGYFMANKGNLIIYFLYWHGTLNTAT